MQGTIFRSALIQGTILIVPRAMEAAYLLSISVEIIHVLCNYVITQSFMNRPPFVYKSESESAC